MISIIIAAIFQLISQAAFAEIKVGGASQGATWTNGGTVADQKSQC